MKGTIKKNEIENNIFLCPHYSTRPFYAKRFRHTFHGYLNNGIDLKEDEDEDEDGVEDGEGRDEN